MASAEVASNVNDASILRIVTRPSTGKGLQSQSDLSKLRSTSAARAGKATVVANTAKSPLEAMRGKYQTKLRSKVDTVRRISMATSAFQSSISAREPSSGPLELSVNTLDLRRKLKGEHTDRERNGSETAKSASELLHSPGKLRQFFAEVRLEQSVGSSHASTPTFGTVQLKEFSSVQQKYKMMKAKSASLKNASHSGTFDQQRLKNSGSNASTLQTPFADLILAQCNANAKSNGEGGGGRRRSTTAPPGSSLVPVQGMSLASASASHLPSVLGSTSLHNTLPLPSIKQDEEAETEEPMLTINKRTALEGYPAVKQNSTSLYSRATLPLINMSNKQSIVAHGAFERLADIRGKPERPATLGNLTGSISSTAESMANQIPPDLVTPILQLLIEAAAKHQQQLREDTHVAVLKEGSNATDSAKLIEETPAQISSTLPFKPASKLSGCDKPRTRLPVATVETGINGSDADATPVSKPFKIEESSRVSPSSKPNEVCGMATKVAHKAIKVNGAKKDTKSEPHVGKKEELKAEDSEPSPKVAAVKPKVVRSKVAAAPVNNSESPAAELTEYSKYSIPAALEAVANAPEGAFDSLVECECCGRKFAKERLEKHAAICEKNASKQRKPFNEEEMRRKGTDLESATVTKTSTRDGGAEKPKPLKQKNWRDKRNEFINAIRAAKEVQAHVAAGGKASDLPPPPPTIDPDAKPCPFCSRKFSENAYPRHVAVCEKVTHKPSPVKRR